MRKAAGLMIAGLLVVGVEGLQAQDTAARSKDKAVTVSGCVEQAQKTGSLADDTGAGTAATPSRAPIEANTAELVNAFLLTNATPTGDRSADKGPTSYTLQGREQELAKHKGHRVTVSAAGCCPRGPRTRPDRRRLRRALTESRSTRSRW